MKNLYTFCAIITCLLAVYSDIKNHGITLELIIVALLFMILSEIQKTKK